MSASIPGFDEEWITCGESDSEIDKFFRSANWITNKLMDQTLSYKFKLADMMTNKINISSIKSKELSERNCNILFPEKRKFMNY